jgi:rhomboid protease GluP
MNQNQTPPEYPQTPPPQRIQIAVPTARPYATYVLLGMTVLIYLLQLGSQSLFGQDWLYVLGAKYGPFIRQGELWRLITPVFLHASILHIGFNMYALFLYGRGIEARFGHARFLLLYFLSAFAGNVLSFLLTPNPAIGASTAIFGLLAAEAVFIIRNRQLFGAQANRALLNLFFIAAVNLVIGFSTTGVDNFGHLGGLIGGWLFSWFGGPRWQVEGSYPNMRLIDEREGRGSLAGTTAVLLFFIPLAALGWIWIVK